MAKKIRRTIAGVTAAALLLGACTTREGRIGADDGTDSCRTQLVALDSTGDFFGEDIIRGAAIGAGAGALLGAGAALLSGRRGSDVAVAAGIGAVAGGVAGAAAGYLNALQQQNRDQAAISQAISTDLGRENQQLQRTQIAFDQLMDCRFFQAQRVREDLRAGRISRAGAEAQMGTIRSRTQRDIELARMINQNVIGRGEQFDTAVESVAPGTKAAYEATKARVRTVQTTARAPAPIRLRPDAASPEVGRIAARDAVQVRPASGGFAQVETSDGRRGYVPVSSLGTQVGTSPVAAVASREGGDVRQLAATNIARRDNFAESVGNAERLAAGSGFELAS